MEKKEFFIYKRSNNEEKYKEKISLDKGDHLCEIFIVFFLYFLILAQCLLCIGIMGDKKKEGACKMTLVFKNFNHDSVLFFSTDLLGETKVLLTNLLYLKEICEK